MLEKSGKYRICNISAGFLRPGSVEHFSKTRKPLNFAIVVINISEQKATNIHLVKRLGEADPS